MGMHYYVNTTGCLEEVNLCARLVCTKTDFLHVLQARTQGGGGRGSPSHLEKKFRSKVSERGEKVPPR